jgi:hypothetical protein
VSGGTAYIGVQGATGVPSPYYNRSPLSIAVFDGAGASGAPAGATGTAGATGPIGATGPSGGGGGGSGLLAVLQYEPSTAAIYSTASASMAAVDSTNLTISFTAPSSGNVLVRLTGAGLAIGGYVYWGLLPHGGGSQVGNSWCIAGANITDAGSAAFYITGLVSGNTYQYDWAFSTTGTGYLVVQGGTNNPSQGNASPAVMEVWSA